jgi:hypothetical protein
MMLADGLFAGRRMGLVVMLLGAVAGGSLTGVTSQAAAESSPSEVRTEPAEATAGGVLLRGELNPGGLPTTYRYEYGRTSPVCDEGCALRTTVVAGPLTGSVPQEAPPIEVTGLEPGESYWYQLIAENEYGTTTGEVREFTAAEAGEPPSEVRTEPAEATAGGVLLRGELNPGGPPTTFYYEYSRTSTVCDEGCAPQRTVVAGPLTGSVLQEAPPIEVTGLEPGESYWYQLIASNEYGTTAGDVREFTAAKLGEPPSEVRTEPESKLDPPALLLTPPIAISPPGWKTTAPGQLTRARKLANALKACESKPKRQRARCERRAGKRYGTAAKATKKTGRQAGRGKQ